MWLMQGYSGTEGTNLGIIHGSKCQFFAKNIFFALFLEIKTFYFLEIKLEIKTIINGFKIQFKPFYL
jgi:hypothetical protein